MDCIRAEGTPLQHLCKRPRLVGMGLGGCGFISQLPAKPCEWLPEDPFQCHHLTCHTSMFVFVRNCVCLTAANKLFASQTHIRQYKGQETADVSAVARTISEQRVSCLWTEDVRVDGTNRHLVIFEPRIAPQQRQRQFYLVVASE